MTNWTPDKIKGLRCKLNMDQIAFAAALFTTQTTISRWENNHVSPDRRATSLLNGLEKNSEKEQP